MGDQVLPDLERIGPDTPLRLAVAAAIAFPGGGMTASGLRKEYLKGRLAFERIANKDFVTLREIEAMRKQCAQSNPHGSSYGPHERKSDSRQFGSSSTTDGKSAQVAAKASAQRLRTRLRNISKRQDSQHSAKVIQIKS
jgi:hypothetical protein